ncbi:MAG: choice-of-anchor Q domain-containing protein [Verrucomicrobiota bacterium]|jgi:hypothetical protein
MNKRSSNRSLLWGMFFAAFCLAASPGWSQVLFFATSSAAQSNNTVDYVSPGGTPNGSVFTANGTGGNGVIRCTAIALDSSAQKVFLLDAKAQTIWSMNLDGTSLASVATIATGTPTDLALDTAHQQIYFTTSSCTQASNTIQRVSYSGAGGTVLFTATGSSGNGVSRCTALALDLLHSQIVFSDAGAKALWSVPLEGGSVATSVKNNLLAAPLDLALDVTNQFIYYVTSGTIQSNNTVQRIDYGGATNTLLFVAAGGGSVQRCTAIDFDPAASKLYLADAGAGILWSLDPDGLGLATVETGVLSIPRRVRLLPSLPFTVVNFSDNGPGSLRQALLDNGIFSSIIFSNGLFSASAGVVQLSTVGDTTFGPSAFIITNHVSITGPIGSNGVVIARSNGAPAMRLFYVAPGGSLTLNGVTLSNGLSQGGAGGSGFQRGGSGGGGGGMGGAVFIYDGRLDLENSTLAGNQALGGDGGGGAAGGGQGSGGGGGGLGGDGAVGGENSTGGNGGGPSGGAGGTETVSGAGGGIAGGGGGGGSSGTSGSGSGPGGSGGFAGGGGGGGAYNTVGFGGGSGGSGGVGGFGGGGGGPGGGTPGGATGAPGFGGGGSGATADNTGNTGSAGGGGAGLGGAVFSLFGETTVTNCTFSGNQAVGGTGGSMIGSLGSNGMGFGGGIFIVNGSIEVLNATFAFNRADQGGGGICNLGYDETSTVFIRNAILADTLSAASDYLSTNLYASTNMDLGNNNLIQVNNGFSGGLVSTADPRLTPLQNNGGPTWTHALLNGSPAIDAGDNTALPATDQRGYPRIVDGDGDGSAIVDLGAVEDGLVLLATVPQSPQAIDLNGFEFSLTGETNRNYVLEYSTDLADWNPVSTNLVPSRGVITLFDTTAINSSRQRYYRAFALP